MLKTQLIGTPTNKALAQNNVCWRDLICNVFWLSCEWTANALRMPHCSRLKAQWQWCNNKKGENVKQQSKKENIKTRNIPIHSVVLGLLLIINQKVINGCN